METVEQMRPRRLKDRSQMHQIMCSWLFFFFFHVSTKNLTIKICVTVFVGSYFGDAVGFMCNKSIFTNCAGLQLCLHSVIVSWKLLIDVGLDHVVLWERPQRPFLSQTVLYSIITLKSTNSLRCRNTAAATPSLTLLMAAAQGCRNCVRWRLK